MLFTNQKKAGFVIWMTECGDSYANFKKIKCMFKKLWAKQICQKKFDYLVNILTRTLSVV